MDFTVKKNRFCPCFSQTPMDEELLSRRSSKKGALLVALFCSFLVVLAVVAVLSINFSPKAELPPGELDRIECPGLSEKGKCLAKQCQWQPVKNGPACFMNKTRIGYTLLSHNSSEKGIVVELKSKNQSSLYGDSIENVRFEAFYVTENIVRFKLTDAGKKRYEVPVQNEFTLLKNSAPSLSSLEYDIVLENTTVDSEFVFRIRRKSDGTSVWDTSIGGLVMSNQFLQMASYLPSANIYGLGEHPHDSFKHDLNYKTWPMFSRDQPPRDGPLNLYGVHPYYTCLEYSGKSHGVLFLNSNAMEVTLMPAPAISFRAIGGVLDFFVVLGDHPEHVVQLYTSLVGRPVMPPYWSLGFQLSRYGYNHLDDVKRVVERTRKASIAQDVQFVDIDHMEGNRDFTWDKERFAGLGEYMNKTKEEYGLRWIIILDPAIEAVTSGYDPFSSGLKNDVFIKRSFRWKKDMFTPEVSKMNVTFGKVWPQGVVAFPDFFKDATKNWWKNQIISHHENIPFDGLWIDMNEPANFGTNQDRPDYCKWQELPTDKCWSLKCPESPLEDPPYNPLASSGTDRLSKMTLCMESIQGETKASYLHYDVHSLYGWSQSQATLEGAQLSTGTRSLVISRSTYPSSGRYSGHWLGDNQSRWPDLHRSVIGIMEFNLFGIPYIGADICGFFEDTTDEMCKRWMQLGAFYTFFRNHNGMGQKDQDPAILSEDAKEASKLAVERRYTLLPYLYTLFYRAHVDGNTVIRPLFHEFPLDNATWSIDRQFLWGKWLLVSPVLNEGVHELKMYLPQDEWYYFDYEKSRREKVTGTYVTTTNIHEQIPLHVRAGAILPTQDYALKTSLNEEARNITLFVFPKSDFASGEFFADDGLSKDTIENGHYLLFDFQYHNCVLTIAANHKVESVKPESLLKRVHVFKVNRVDDVTLNATSDDRESLSFEFDEAFQVLTIEVNAAMREIAEIRWRDKQHTCQMFP